MDYGTAIRVRRDLPGPSGIAGRLTESTKVPRPLAAGWARQVPYRVSLGIETSGTGALAIAVERLGRIPLHDLGAAERQLGHGQLLR